jgi:hypothetical protein
MEKKWGLFLISLCLFPVLAHGENFQFEVSKSNCQRIVKYVAEQDVTFKPGVDVHGRTVAPADLNESKLKLPETIYIDLSLPFKDLLRDYNPKLKNSDVYVGQIEYNISSGAMLFNGQPLADLALNAIARECRKKYP